MYNLLNILNTMLINNLKTGNTVIDYILNIVSISFITFFFHNINYLKKYILQFFSMIIFLDDRKSEIIIDAHNLATERNGYKTYKLSYSKNFQAIVYFIKELKTDEIFSKREADGIDKETNPMFDIFIPDQDKPFLLDKEKDIKCTIKLKESEINNDFIF